MLKGLGVTSQKGRPEAFRMPRPAGSEASPNYSQVGGWSGSGRVLGPRALSSPQGVYTGPGGWASALLPSSLAQY